MAIPSNVEKEHILQAIDYVDKHGTPDERQSTKFVLTYKNQKYSPKYLISLANVFANGKELMPSYFSGGEDTNNFLEKKGFKINEIIQSNQNLDNDNTQLEQQFHKDMIEIYQKAKNEAGYNASRFLQMVAEQGGYAVAKSFINNNSTTEGFISLWERKRLDLTVEALVLKETYVGLFNDDERLVAKNRLKQYGYEVNIKIGTPKDEVEDNVNKFNIPKLEPKSRSREYDSYNETIRDKVIYEYLFNARTHRWLDENILGLNVEYSRGYQSMEILHYIGLKDKHKGLFKNIKISDAIIKLKQSSVSDYSVVIVSLERLNTEIIDNIEFNDIDEEKEYAEGKEAFRTHRYRERDARLIKEAKKLFKQRYGELFCEVCGINFEKVYGIRGKNFIEAHHRKPVSEMKEGEKTKLEDIVMLCSNCHRMIHRKPLMTVQGLANLTKTRKIHK